MCFFLTLKALPLGINYFRALLNLNLWNARIFFTSGFFPVENSNPLREWFLKIYFLVHLRVYRSYSELLQVYYVRKIENIFTKIFTYVVAFCASIPTLGNACIVRIRIRFPVRTSLDK